MNHGFIVDDDGRGSGLGYEWKIDYPGAFALATVNLQSGCSINAEAGAMVSMSPNVDLTSKMKGGLIGAIKRSIGGESAFISTFTAENGPGEVTLAPATPGDVVGLEMRDTQYLVQSSSYLAGDTSLVVDTKFGGMKSWLGGEGLFLLNISGSGLLLVSSFGSIHRKTLRAGERYVVDTGHMVAWEASMPYEVRKASKKGLIRSMLSGEGLVAEFTGPGELLLQTRNLRAFATHISRYLPTKGGQ